VLGYLATIEAEPAAEQEMRIRMISKSSIWEPSFALRLLSIVRRREMETRPVPLGRHGSAGGVRGPSGARSAGLPGSLVWRGSPGLGPARSCENCARTFDRFDSSDRSPGLTN